MKLVIMGITALALLGGGGAGAYFFLAGTPAVAAEEEAVKEEKYAKDEYEKKAHFEFVEMDPLILPIVDENGVSQIINMSVVLEVFDTKAAENVKRMSPRLKDAFIQDMYGVLNQHAALKGGVVQVSQIKKRLNAISNHVMGEDQVNDVLLQVVHQRPI